MNGIQKAGKVSMRWREVAVATVLIFSATSAVQALSDTEPRALALGQAYTALARGPEAVFWNPANLALSGEPKFKWELLGGGLTLITENNSFSVRTYNANFTDDTHRIGTAEKKELLGDIPRDGLRFNADLVPFLSAGLPLNGGISFPLRNGIQAAVTTNVAFGVEGEMPKDMFELMLFGNEFDRRYDIARWDGSSWIVGGVNFAAAKPWMPDRLASHLREFTVGGTLKISGGGYGEITRSGGGMISRIQGTDLEGFALVRRSGGLGFGVDFGVAGVTTDGRTTFSAGMLNLVDFIPAGASDRGRTRCMPGRPGLRVTRFLDPDQVKMRDVLENEDLDGDGDPDFREKFRKDGFSRSLPAMLRAGIAHWPMPHMTVVGNYDQALSSGFGISPMPKISTGSGVPAWCRGFRRGSVCQSRGRSSSTGVGFAFGPINVGHAQFEFFDLALVTRGGLLPRLLQRLGHVDHVFPLQPDQCLNEFPSTGQPARFRDGSWQLLVPASPQRGLDPLDGSDHKRQSRPFCPAARQSRFIRPPHQLGTEGAHEKRNEAPGKIQGPRM